MKAVSIDKLLHSAHWHTSGDFGQIHKRSHVSFLSLHPSLPLLFAAFMIPSKLKQNEFFFVSSWNGRPVALLPCCLGACSSSYSNIMNIFILHYKQRCNILLNVHWADRSLKRSAEYLWSIIYNIIINTICNLIDEWTVSSEVKGRSIWRWVQCAHLFVFRSIDIVVQYDYV